ncbi:hypothetical protein PTKIN_Ptkin16aG0119600 [Pterospermum kingtungense]
MALALTSLTFSTAIPLLNNPHLQSSNVPISSSSPSSPTFSSSKPFVFSWKPNTTKDVKSHKDELSDLITPFGRGTEATPEDQQRMDQIALKLESINEKKEPLKSNFLNGKWELLYKTSQQFCKQRSKAFSTGVRTFKWLKMNSSIRYAFLG